MLYRDAYLKEDQLWLDKNITWICLYRRDASSRLFSQITRWGNFYSVGASWLLMKEDSWKMYHGWADLKPKAAYGTVGNDGLSTYYEHQALYDPGWNNAAGATGAIATTGKTWPDGKWTKLSTLVLISACLIIIEFQVVWKYLTEVLLRCCLMYSSAPLQW